MTLTKKFKAHVSDFVIRLGPIQTSGELIAVRVPQAKPKASKTVSVTPDGRGVKQFYLPVNNLTGSEKFTMGELEKGLPNDDGTFTIIPKAAIAEAKEPDVPKDTMAVTVHPLDQIEDSLFPSDDNAYVFEPHSDDPVNVQWYSLLWDAIKNVDGKAFIGAANVRNSEGLYRLTIWRDRIVLQRVLYPEDLNDHERLDIDPIDETIADKFHKQLDKITTDFDARSYRDKTKERVAAVTAAFVAAGDDNTITITPKVKKPAFDIMDALEAFDSE